MYMLASAFSCHSSCSFPSSFFFKLTRTPIKKNRESNERIEVKALLLKLSNLYDPFRKAVTATITTKNCFIECKKRREEKNSGIEEYNDADDNGGGGGGSVGDGDEDNDWWTIGSSAQFTCVCAINENIFGYNAEPLSRTIPPYKLLLSFICHLLLVLSCFFLFAALLFFLFVDRLVSLLIILLSNEII